MTHSEETEIEMARRHVREGEEHVARQREIIDRLPSTGEVAEIARTLLADYEDSLALHRAHLGRLQG
ncbi:hypothetical protein Rumeso_01408 [Rubellimicrobium mesophilum DSM 19309]|uniref:Uncharacterized protein n=1 Tax=Rubellimicrobium mesophilum DSM 19309 TaxID=442562 RepID=A0A017HS74_9RHOB|nr:hypothetical protein [Rubellimicrobium mesophilum]EYD76998.1 hypothetical protein Rumeso_01408 [Rubellimicrobium mesophilum DSM 19309]